MDITEAYLKEHFINAYFVDQDRKHIAILSSDPDDKKVIETIIEHDMEHPWCKALFSVVDIDHLHENTYQKLKLEREEFEKTVMDIAKRDNILSESITVKSFPEIIKILFDDVDNEDHMFALKLALFENSKISESEDKELKKELRQSKNKIDALSVALKFFK